MVVRKSPFRSFKLVGKQDKHGTPQQLVSTDPMPFLASVRRQRVDERAGDALPHDRRSYPSGMDTTAKEDKKGRVRLPLAALR